MSNLELYAEIDRRRAERYARRMERIEREERRERILGPIKYGLQIVAGAFLLYVYLFFGALWASM